MHDLFDGRLAAYGVTEAAQEYATKRSRCLTDGEHYVQVYAASKPNGEAADAVGHITCTAGNDPNRILHAIAEEFVTHIFDDNQPQYWGFDTQAERDAWLRDTDKSCERIDADIVNFAAGKSHDLEPGTVAMEYGERAKRLVAARPELLLPEAKDELLAEAKRALHQEWLEVRRREDGGAAERMFKATLQAIQHRLGNAT